MGKPSQVGAASVVENSSHTPPSPHTPLSAHTPDSRFPIPDSLTPALYLSSKYFLQQLYSFKDLVNF
ncbi:MULTISPECIES: hypothetical protein [Moorena]|uniref:hypothetical protein n=1 Tax=Moorena TaxID=1155738 RepID=UPI0005C965EC|nr:MULTISPECIES: hypothetical protein [Moorena]NEQ15399.1 hypothetical protein [Moorena sp. SIO3E2]NEP33234.1 hypothetical protein [Moorena sp. SIO3B2]NEP69867.1 hypothetical protein [Moorena sp. SIO3A5]NEQ05881.1 hypothetical protein [Moorena sp. SIO4E2]NER91593.1 hypothetical protein [Moorena sp. SIO3A2]